MVFLLLGLSACASHPSVPATGRGAAWGYVRLVPREGLPAQTGRSASYGDRRLAGVELVDYSRPGFVVVYDAEGRAAGTTETLRLAVRDGVSGPRLDPAHGALRAGGAIEVVNQAGDAHVVSCPGAGLVRRLEPGAALHVDVPTPGEWPVFLLDAPQDPVRIFATPGAFSVVSEAGRFELADLEPGRHELAAWHPRFPPTTATIEVQPGEVVRVDLELRVDHRGLEVGDAR
jgi:hypothetical protein